VGWIGELQPELARDLGLRDETLVGEIVLTDLVAKAPGVERFVPLPTQPAVLRDLSVVCDATLPAREIGAFVRRSAGPLLRDVAVSDRFEGGSLPAGKVSLTVTLRYQDQERTLTGEEVQQSVGVVVAALKARGAEIRGE
jgi:phenylalanyl-tRNA synthetase beta chain